ncbi:hypothetical protein [Gracilibacillus sp. YIM 98692]|uniref:YkoP family protein n=1 Tax=Gracilibacillus sp. YIM 98692 TaxID=2663532 RepID=UPI0013D675BC|nr:hypothetical protein [Gracilibacillus sp. YIM 98692]
MRNQVRDCILHAWNFWDPIYYSCTRLKYVENPLGEKTIMRVRLTKYKGERIILQDGTVIQKNDILLKIHLHNVRLLKKFEESDSDVKKAYIIYYHVRESLPELVRFLQSEGYVDQVKGIIGITMLHKGCKKLGFEVFPLRNKYYQWFKTLALIPIYFLSAKTCKKNPPLPMYLMMSKDRLMQKYQV